ncbi:hypothetical protein GCM10023091_30560 [Ravibacter arvi]|uniref:Calcineurin-like phosphoesterase domain-containing protein n=1 Tax=Ravibacter arvi TaxID=2051041 RepID=A0ABP8M529_9BACT
MPERSENTSDKYLNLGHTAAENHAKTQQKLYEKHVAETSSVTRRLDEFFKTNIFGFAWHYLKSRFGKRHAYPFYPVDGDNGVYRMQPSDKEGAVTVTLLSDWANDTRESDQIAHLVAQDMPGYTLHLGDVYYVGTREEIRENFTAPHASWYFGKSGSLALSGNHEMYSNGNAFFDHLLTAMYAMEGDVKHTQRAGFFCLENDFWRVIGLDTGYTSVGHPLLEVLFAPDSHLRKEQTDWLEEQVRLGDPHDKRGLIFLSHHPVLSGFRKEYPRPASQIAALMAGASRPAIWFWGHEHRLIGYKFREVCRGLSIYGRCIGVGGMPVETDEPGDREVIGQLDFYDRRVRKKIRRHQVGYNAYVALTFRGNQLTASYKDLESNLILEEKWEVELETGALRHEVLRHTPKLSWY